MPSKLTGRDLWQIVFSKNSHNNMSCCSSKTSCSAIKICSLVLLLEPGWVCNCLEKQNVAEVMLLSSKTMSERMVQFPLFLSSSPLPPSTSSFSPPPPPFSFLSPSPSLLHSSPLASLSPPATTLSKLPCWEGTQVTLGAQM